MIFSVDLCLLTVTLITGTALADFEQAVTIQKNTAGGSPHVDVPVQDTSQTPQDSLKTPAERISYMLGFQISQNVPEASYFTFEVIPELVVRGFLDGRAREKLLLSTEQLKKTRTEAEKDMKIGFRRMAERNKQQSKIFLDQNVLRPEVSQTESGFQYEIIKSGKGESPNPTGWISVHYQESLLDGTVFNSTYAKFGGKVPTTLVSDMPNYLAEPLTLMKAGSRCRFYIPPEQGFGEAGLPGQVGPHEVLIVEMELFQVGD